MPNNTGTPNDERVQATLVAQARLLATAGQGLFEPQVQTADATGLNRIHSGALRERGPGSLIR